MSTPVLELRDVKAAYGRIEVLHGVDLVVPQDCVVALLGPNGAGKTTTLKVASGQLRPTSGHVHIAGRHVNGATADELARAGVCAIPEGRGIFPNLTVVENLQMVTFGGVSFKQVEERTYAQFPRLKERRTQLAGTLSGGEQQMLAIARALMSRPEVLLLDEPSLGLSPIMVQTIFEAIENINREGASVLLVEQNANAALKHSHRAYVLETGRVVKAAPAAELLADESVRNAYLGGNTQD
ncbi:MAG TPA: ABC transporter ATP-binding protein [Actinomycetota bacterium]|nr:ABC transporter ATP-binding protein [Actinomycetota bacterium]